MRGIGVAAEWHNEKEGGCNHAQRTRAGGAERVAHNNQQTATLGLRTSTFLATARHNTTQRDRGGRRQPQRGERAGRGLVAAAW